MPRGCTRQSCATVFAGYPTYWSSDGRYIFLRPAISGKADYLPYGLPYVGSWALYTIDTVLRAATQGTVAVLNQPRSQWHPLVGSCLDSHDMCQVFWDQRTQDSSKGENTTCAGSAAFRKLTGVAATDVCCMCGGGRATAWVGMVGVKNGQLVDGSKVVDDSQRSCLEADSAAEGFACSSTGYTALDVRFACTMVKTPDKTWWPTHRFPVSARSPTPIPPDTRSTCTSETCEVGTAVIILGDPVCANLGQQLGTVVGMDTPAGNGMSTAASDDYLSPSYSWVNVRSPSPP